MGSNGGVMNCFCGAISNQTQCSWGQTCTAAGTCLSPVATAAFKTLRRVSTPAKKPSLKQGVEFTNGFLSTFGCTYKYTVQEVGNCGVKIEEQASVLVEATQQLQTLYNAETLSVSQLEQFKSQLFNGLMQLQQAVLSSSCVTANAPCSGSIAAAIEQCHEDLGSLESFMKWWESSRVTVEADLNGLQQTIILDFNAGKLFGDLINSC